MNLAYFWFLYQLGRQGITENLFLIKYSTFLMSFFKIFIGKTIIELINIKEDKKVNFGFKTYLRGKIGNDSVFIALGI